MSSVSSNVNNQNVAFPATLSLPAPRPLTGTEHCFVSLFGMAAAVSAYHPLLTLKNRLQRRSPNCVVPENATAKGISALAPRLGVRELCRSAVSLYKGVGVNMLNAPLYAVMGTVDGVVNNALSQNGTTQLSQAQKASVAAMSAFVATVPGCAINLLVVQKQMREEQTKQKVVWSHLCKEMVSVGGYRSLLSGMVAIQSREVPFGLAMLFGVNAAKPYVDGLLPTSVKKNRETYVKYLSMFAVATLTTYATQPSDYVTGKMQQDWDRKKYRNPVHAVRTLYQEGGYKAFYTGTVPRLMAFNVATCVLMNAKDCMTNHLQKP